MVDFLLHGFYNSLKKKKNITNLWCMGAKKLKVGFYFVATMEKYQGIKFKPML